MTTPPNNRLPSDGPQEMSAAKERDPAPTPLEKPMGPMFYTITKGANVWPSWPESWKWWRKAG